MRKTTLIVATLVFLSGCVSLQPIESIDHEKTAKLTVYRSDQIQGSVAQTFIGWDDKYYLELAPKEYSSVTVPAGLQTIQIKAHVDITNELTLEVAQGQDVCLMAEVNPQNIVGVNWLVSGYRLRQVQCLGDEALGHLTFVERR